MDREAIAKLLEENGLLPTTRRVDIAELVFAKPQHLSAQQIRAGMSARGSQVSKATVYNTMKLFSECGLVRTVEVDPHRQYYDSTIDPHHHFYNIDTGELTDIPPAEIDFKLTAALPPGTEQESIDVVIRVRSPRD